jgi:RHH-type transcriptional regulator, proline utilization regulon repressor / proline dehydrogenase / delta 1-pyrroline-5-carboxylate dehydrogenase
MGLFSRKPKSAVAPAASPVPSSQPSSHGGREGRIFDLGSDLLRRARAHKTGILSSKFYTDSLMNWSMKDPEFKVQFFRFVDAFPTFRSSDAVHEHFADYMSQPGVKPPPGMELGLRAGGLAKGLMASTISSSIKTMAGKFIAGTDARTALPGLRALWDDGIAFSVDLLGEVCVSDLEANDYQRKYLDLIQNLPSDVAGWKPQPRLESDHLGPIPRTNVSVKISALSARCDPIDTEGSINDLQKRLLPILETARDRGVFVNFDMEHHALKDFTIELFQRCCERIDFQAGLAMQAYLKSGVDDAKKMADWARRAKRLVTVRLVKGAYWDAETIKAEQNGWPCPVWNSKWQTDACFERMSDAFLDATPKDKTAAAQGGIKLALGSHNVRSIASVLSALEQRNLPREAIELQMLHGMADQLKYAAAELSIRVREYVPVGEMIPGMAYLVRRLLENTSNESWLKAGFLDNADPASLLASPESKAAQLGEAASKIDLALQAPERHQLSPAFPAVGDSRPFFNESLRDFSDAAQRSAFSAAIARATVPKVSSDRTPQHADAMIARALAAFPAWRDTPAQKRAAVLTRAAALMRQQRDGLAAVMIREAGKTWREADADVCEAIDFCEYYARLAIPLFDRHRLGRFIGELDHTLYQPRGVAAVIAPWNFPLAIAAGMTVAALVTGNTVILKPAEQTPGVASIFADILYEAGCPKDVLHFCPAPGETTGAAIVRDPRVALIAFTGSKAVGLDIIQAASLTPNSQHHVKKVVCEMGGKNAVIIDTSADIDEAVLAVRHSAFAFQGQKCSAASRVIVVDPDGPDGPAISNFTTRLVEASRALTIADPALPGTDVGPVIDHESKDKILRYMQLGKSNAKLQLALDVPPGLEQTTGRAYVGPAIFSHLAPDHPVASDEIFGPILAILHAKDFDEALSIANSSPYKLTGGLFSRKPAHIELAKQNFRVGNLYINRGITGALVARQPFGGFGMSGVGSKAGGSDYLLQFVEPRAITENTMRRGFAPEL